jgi:hypothetical protein
MKYSGYSSGDRVWGGLSCTAIDGVGVIGGMMLAAFVVPIFVPLFFSWLAGNRHQSSVKKKWGKFFMD